MPSAVHCKLDIEASGVGLQATAVSSTTVLGRSGSWVHSSSRKTVKVTVPAAGGGGLEVGAEVVGDEENRASASHATGLAGWVSVSTQARYALSRL